MIWKEILWTKIINVLYNSIERVKRATKLESRNKNISQILKKSRNLGWEEFYDLTRIDLVLENYDILFGRYD